MPKTVKYIGTVTRWPELATTGKQSTWWPGQQEQRSDTEAAQLLATGLFSDVDATQLPEEKVRQISGVVSGDWNANQQAVIDGGGGLVVADDAGNLTGPGGAIAGGGGGGSTTFAALTDKTTVDIPATNTPTATALALKAPLASPTFTGTPAAPTALAGTNTTQVATTAFVLANAGGSFGPYADAAALESAKPAASNNGRLATVGAAAPYTLYASNGTGWTIQRAGTDPQAFALANPLSVPVLAFRNNWANYGAPTQPLYASLTGGVVNYSGRTKNTGTHVHSNVAFDLPTGFEPAAVSVGVPSVLVSSGSTIVTSWAVFQGAAAPPNCAIGVAGGGSTAVFIYDMACSFESSKKLGAAAYKRFAAVSDDVSILFPPNYGASLKVCLYFHSNGGDYLSHITSAVGGTQGLMRDTLLALLADGWTVISSSGGAIASNWGNPASWSATQAVLDWVKSEFVVSKISVLSQSMGGLPGLRALIDYPGITNWYGIFPVCDITTMYAAYTATIDTAYGGSSAYTAALPTCNPMQRTTSLFASKNLRMSHSAADTVVSKTTNSDALLTKVTGVAASVVVTATSGDHGNPSSFIPADVVAHMNL